MTETIISNTVNSYFTYETPSEKWIKNANGYYSNTIVPAIEYHANGAPRGVRIEESRKNELNNSLTFENWGGNASFTFEDANSLFEGKVGRKITNDGSNPFRVLSQFTPDANLDLGTVYTFQLIFEQGNADRMQIGIYDSPTWISVFYFYFGNNTLVDAGGGKYENYWSEDLGTGPNGGNLFHVAVSANITSNAFTRMMVYPTGTTINTDYIYLHYVGLEEGRFPTSPIITEANTITRNADVIYKMTSNSDMYDLNRESGTIVVEMEELHDVDLAGDIKYFVSLGNSSNNEQKRFLKSGNSVVFNTYVDSGNGTPYNASLANTSYFNNTSNTNHKFAASWESISANSISATLYVNNTEIKETTFNYNQTNEHDVLLIGCNFNGVNQLNGHLKKLLIYNKKKSNSEILTLMGY